MTPTTNGISFANISHHRSELMGLAMIAIVLFHVNVPRLSPFYGLWRMGHMGGQFVLCAPLFARN